MYKKILVIIGIVVIGGATTLFINNKNSGGSSDDSVVFSVQSSGWGRRIPKLNGGISESSPYVMPIYHDFSQQKIIFVRPDLYPLTEVAGSVDMNATGRPKRGLPHFYRTWDFLDGDDYASIGENNDSQWWTAKDNLDISEESSLSYRRGNVRQTNGPSIWGTMPIVMIEYTGGSPSARNTTNSGPIRFFGGTPAYREDKSCCKNHLGVLFEFRDSDEVWNMPPSSQDDIINIQGDEGTTFNILNNDLDYEQDNLFVYQRETVQYPEAGITVSKDGTVTYAPKEGQCGEYKFSYRSIDRDPDTLHHMATIYEGKIGLSPLRGKVTINHICTVQAQNDAVTITSKDQQTIDVLANDNIHGSTTNIVTIIQDAHLGNSSIQNNTLTYTPPLSSMGDSTSIVYQVCDQNNSCAQATVQLNLSVYGQVQVDTPQDDIIEETATVPQQETEQVVPTKKEEIPVRVIEPVREETQIIDNQVNQQNQEEEKTHNAPDENVEDKDKANDTQEATNDQEVKAQDEITTITNEETNNQEQEKVVENDRENEGQQEDIPKEPNTVVDTQKEKAICGNAKIEQNEQCDDGNTTNGDACSNTCQKETRYCGDGIVQRPNEGGIFEQCDDGNTQADDSCDGCKLVVSQNNNAIKTTIKQNEITLIGYNKPILVQSTNNPILVNNKEGASATLDSNHNYALSLGEEINNPETNQKIIIMEKGEKESHTFRIYNTDYIGTDHASPTNNSNRLSITNKGTNIAAQLMLVIDDINNEAINNNITEQQRIKLDVIVATYQKKYDQNEMMIMLNKIQATRASNTEISDFTHLMRQYLLTQWVNQLAE